MTIFHIFSAVCLIGILIKIIQLFMPNSNGEDKIARAIYLLLGMILLSISWGIIYAFFDFNEKDALKTPQKESIIKFEKKNG